MDKDICPENTEQCHQCPTADTQENRYSGNPAGLSAVTPAQCTGNQRADTYTGSGSQANHHILGGKGQRKSGKAVFRYPCHKNTVHYIVQCLNKHREHDGHCHTQQQFSFIHFSHSAGIDFSHVCHYHLLPLIPLGAYYSVYA